MVLLPHPLSKQKTILVIAEVQTNRLGHGNKLIVSGQKILKKVEQFLFNILSYLCKRVRMSLVHPYTINLICCHCLKKLVSKNYLWYGHWHAIFSG